MPGAEQVGRGRDRRTFNYLIGRYSVDIRTALMRRFSDQDGVEDAVQNACMKFSGLSDRDSVADPRAYLFVMARNALRDAMRRASSQKRHWTAWAETPSMTLPELTPEDILMRREQQAALDQALSALSPEARELLRLSRIEGLTYAEISRLTNRSPADISRRIAAALIDLRQRLDAAGSEAA